MSVSKGRWHVRNYDQQPGGQGSLSKGLGALTTQGVGAAPTRHAKRAAEGSRQVRRGAPRRGPESNGVRGNDTAPHPVPSSRQRPTAQVSGEPITCPYRAIPCAGSPLWAGEVSCTNPTDRPGCLRAHQQHCPLEARCIAGWFLSACMLADAEAPRARSVRCVHCHQRGMRLPGRSPAAPCTGRTHPERGFLAILAAR